MMKKKTGTKEWAETNENIQTGCEHDCLYCYAKCMAIRFGRATALSWKQPEIRAATLTKPFKKRSGRIMFPTTHDITPSNVWQCLFFLFHLLEPGNHVLIVTKPHVDCIENLCREFHPYKSQILFRFTIGSADDEVLRFWEPGAPCFNERLDSLILAQEQGFQTSVSCEPMLDANIEAVVQAIEPYVTDSIWIGKANRLRQIISLNCPGDSDVAQRAGELISIQSDARIMDLHDRYKDHEQIRWKDSSREVIDRLTARTSNGNK
jgi:DNA repair photolyase